MNQLQHSFARVSPSYRRAIGSRGCYLPAPAATFIPYRQRYDDSRALGRARGACCRHAPADGRLDFIINPSAMAGFCVLLTDLQTSRGLTSSGAFSGIRSGCRRPVANIDTSAAQDPINHVAKPLERHFIRSIPLPSPALGQPSYGETRDVGAINQGRGND